MSTVADTLTSPTTTAGPIGRPGRISGWVLTGLLAAFCLFDAFGKLFPSTPVIEATEQMGFARDTLPVMGVLMLLCLVLFVLPRTTTLGAILMTGYFGGAVCAQLRVDAPLFSTLLFPVYFGIAVWVAAWLRSPAVRRLTADLAGR